MARIHLRKAAKDYPANGIKKSDQYYFVKIKTGPYSSRTIRSLTRPKRWELTTSDFYSQLWPIEDERFGEVTEASDLNDIASDLRALGDEQQGKFDNMPDGLQQGDTGQQVELRSTQCGEWADAIETIANDLESKLAEFDTATEQYAAAKAEYDNAMAEYDPDGDEPEPDEPAVPEELSDCSDPDDPDEVQRARQTIADEAAQEAQDANPGID